MNQNTIKLNILQRCPLICNQMTRGDFFKIINIFQEDFVVLHPLLYSSPTSFTKISEVNITTPAMYKGTILHNLIQKNINKTFQEISSKNMYQTIYNELKQENKTYLPQEFYLDDYQIRTSTNNIIKALKKIKSQSFTNEKLEYEHKVKNEILMIKGSIDLYNSTQIIEIKSRINNQQYLKYIQQLSYYYVQQLLVETEFNQKTYFKPIFIPIQKDDLSFDEQNLDIEKNIVLYVADVINSRNARLLEEQNFISQNSKKFNNKMLNTYYETVQKQYQEQLRNRILSQEKYITQLNKQGYYQQTVDRQQYISNINSVLLQPSFVNFKIQEKQVIFEDLKWLSNPQEIKNKQKILIVASKEDQEQYSDILENINGKIINYDICKKFQSYYKPDVAILVYPPGDLEYYCLILFGYYPTYIISNNKESQLNLYSD